MLTILHVSDLHFGPHYSPAAGEALLRAATELEVKLIVASGDFTQRAKREQYAAARAFLDRLPPLPVVVTPGNHDVPLYRVFERVLSPYRYYRQFISSELDSVLRLDQAVVVSLNSTSPLRALVNGRIDGRQLDWCARALADTPSGLPRILVTHHPFAPAPDYESGPVLAGARRVLGRLEELGIELIMGGHLHRAYIGSSLDVLPGAEGRRGILVVQSGTSSSWRGRAREHRKHSFNLVRLSAASIAVTQYMFFAELEGFAPVGHHTFPRAGASRLASDDIGLTSGAVLATSPDAESGA